MRQILEAGPTARLPLQETQLLTRHAQPPELCLFIPNRYSLQTQEEDKPGLGARILDCACPYLLKALLYHIECFGSIAMKAENGASFLLLAWEGGAY